ncbi:MAG: divalent-cation tolerance protein CutA [Epsilonproteobacteria bacterium]|nr:divalent-cation tolerance protein CutA [Campylobacterota bacterium]
MAEFVMILTTYPNRKEAKAVASLLLEKKLAACVQLNDIESLYIWEGKIENDPEIRVTIKTKKSNFQAIAETITKLHPYETPQIIEIPITNGSKTYLEWIDSI